MFHLRLRNLNVLPHKPSDWCARSVVNGLLLQPGAPSHQTPVITRERSWDLRWHFTQTHGHTHTYAAATHTLPVSVQILLLLLCLGRKCDSNAFSYVSQTLHVGGRQQYCKWASFAYMHEFVNNLTPKFCCQFEWHVFVLAFYRNVLVALCLLEMLGRCWSSLENTTHMRLQYILHAFVIVRKCPYTRGLFLHVVWCSCRALVFTCQRPHSLWNSLFLQFLNSSHTEHCIKPNPYQTAHSASAIDLCLPKVQGFGIHWSTGVAMHKHRNQS